MDLKETRRKYYLEHKEQWRAYDKKHRVRHNERMRELHQEKKIIVLEHYSKGTLVCAHCGIDDVDVLTLDHVNGGGTQHRLKEGNKTYRWIINNNFPDGFQVLCFNCNWKKRLT